MSITFQQARIYMREKNRGKSQVTAAAKAGISERTGRRLEQSKIQAVKRKIREWRTRADPLDGVWETELLPLLEKEPALTPITLLEHLQSDEAKGYSDRVLRTLQRRVKQWKAVNGTEKEVMFRQAHSPGVMGLSDFTTLKGTFITIEGSPFPHLIYHFRLAYSGWRFVQAFPGGESFTALSEGLQTALQRLGGSPREHRTDSLSAAFKNLKGETQEDVTKRYHDLCEHYVMRPTRNNKGVAHENGAIESAHGHFKRRVTQALLKRGSGDFPTEAAYQAFLTEVAEGLNRRYAVRLEEERGTLQVLPVSRYCDYTVLSAVVTSSSTVNVRLTVYSVPARLIGQRLTVHLFASRLELYLGPDAVLMLARTYPLAGKRRARQIDYRHMIHSLSRKPGAFLHSQLRNDLLPNEVYRQAWQWAQALMLPHQASRWMVGVLALAAQESCEDALGAAITQQYQANQTLPALELLRDQWGQNPRRPTPTLAFVQHAPSAYDALLTAGALS